MDTKYIVCSRLSKEHYQLVKSTDYSVTDSNKFGRAVWGRCEKLSRDS